MNPAKKHFPPPLGWLFQVPELQEAVAAVKVDRARVTKGGKAEQPKAQRES